jgi:hypothetical protein
MTFNLATTLRESACSTPAKTLMHFADQSVNYAQIDEISGRVASALLAQGSSGARRSPSSCRRIEEVLYGHEAVAEARGADPAAAPQGAHGQDPEDRAACRPVTPLRIFCPHIVIITRE